MSRFGVLVMGPAGAGKTTFCAALIQHLRNSRRSHFYVNLDPAADAFAVEPDLDIKELISLDDSMEEFGLGPNGALIACFEYLLANMDFLTAPLDDVGEDALIVIDMPGQIELYTHVPLLPALARELTGGSLNARLCAAYLVEATFVVDRAKFFAAALSAMSAMLLLGLPHVNVLSKMDLVRGKVARRELKRFFVPDADLLDDDPVQAQALRFDAGEDDDGQEDAGADPTDPTSVMRGLSFARLNQAVAKLIDDFGLVSFQQLDVQDEDSVNGILSFIDESVQFHEAQEPREPREDMDDME
jgi:GTPase SAR1 family protein